MLSLKTAFSPARKVIMVGDQRNVIHAQMLPAITCLISRKVVMVFDLGISKSSGISFFGKCFFKVFGFDRRLSNQKTLKMFGPENVIRACM